MNFRAIGFEKLKLPFFAVRSGSEPDVLAEDILEVIGIVVAEAGRYLRYAHIGVDQEILRLADAAAGYVLHR